MKIESLENNKVKEWCKLNNKKYRDEVGLFIIEGDHLVKEALKNNIVKELITTDINIKSDYYINEKIMKKISNQQSISNIIAVCYKLKEKEIGNKVLVLDGIQDPGNLGAMIRSAVAFNFDTILLSDDSVDLYNDKVIRASEGMIFNINIVRKNLDILDDYSDYQIITTDVKDGKNIKDIKIRNKVMLIIGNEGNGVKESISKFSSDKVKLNMNIKCESLNASVAASILMYEVNNYE